LKFTPLTVTGVPPEVGPDLGDMLLTIGAEAGAMLALKLLETVWPAESLARTENENAPVCEGVPVNCPVDPCSDSPGGNEPPTTLQLLGSVFPISPSREGGPLPAGLTLSSGGAIPGTPTQTGTFPLSLSVQDPGTSLQSTNQGFSFSIAASAVKPTSISSRLLF
jgi:hypothetical protein